jgi:hypothetical protein
MKTIFTTLLLLLCLSCKDQKPKSLIEQVDAIQVRSGGNYDLMKSIYETEIKKLESDIYYLKREITYKDSTIDKCMELSLMVLNEY